MQPPHGAFFNRLRFKKHLFGFGKRFCHEKKHKFYIILFTTADWVKSAEPAEPIFLLSSLLMGVLLL